METFTIKRHGVFARMAEHPGGAILGGVVAAAVCGAFGAIYGDAVAIVMGALGAILGAPAGAQMASSLRGQS